MSRVVASVEARMSSSRLPGKMLMDIAGKPLVLHVLDRLSYAKEVDDIVLATTNNSADDLLAETAYKVGYKVFRGDEDDVLQRVVDAHSYMSSDIIVEICGDCPLIDPSIVDLAVNIYKKNTCDVVCTGVHQSYPQGTEVQVFAFDALKKVAETVNDAVVREHVSLYFYENSDKYKIHHLTAPQDLQSPELRLQVDYKEDLHLIQELHKKIRSQAGKILGIREVLACIKKYPELADINKHCEERTTR